MEALPDPAFLYSQVGLSKEFISIIARFTSPFPPVNRAKMRLALQVGFDLATGGLSLETQASDLGVDLYRRSCPTADCGS